jgi:tripartite ATP-independent transporter DctM subunit
MTPFDIGLLALAGICVMIALGLAVPFALMLFSFIGVWAIRDNFDLAVRMISLSANDAIANYFFGVIPLFVFMGFVVSETGLGRDSFDVANRLFRRLTGGLAIATVGANTIFAATTGVSIASAAVFTKVAVPEMVSRGYAPRFAVGVVAGSSVLGMLIPPSVLLILYGILTQQSIGDLFMAGVGPGLLLAVAYSIGIVLMAVFTPGFVGSPGSVAATPMPAGVLLAKGLPITALIAMVLGGIYGGIFTPVEAGAAGSIGALAIALVRGSITWAIFRSILVNTGIVTSTVCFLLVAAQMYSRMLALSGVPMGMASTAAAAQLSLPFLIAVYLVILILLGMILDSTSIMLIVVPIMVPVFLPMGVDLVWLGILTVIAVEVGLLTPPFGVSIFVVKGALDDQSITLGDIFLGAAPFAAIMLVVLVLVALFPQIALFPL